MKTDKFMYLPTMTQDEFAENIGKDEFSMDYIPENSLQHMTARDFYEACAVCYKAVRMEQRVHFPFKDSKEEHLRYSGTTPKERYYMFADGRDDGLSCVPLDDATAFAEWRNQKGPYYEFNGHHPWEILPSGSIEYSMHLQAMKSPNGFYYGLSGSTLHRSKDTIHSYLAMRQFYLWVIREPEAAAQWLKGETERKKV